MLAVIQEHANAVFLGRNDQSPRARIGGHQDGKGRVGAKVLLQTAPVGAFADDQFVVSGSEAVEFHASRPGVILRAPIHRELPWSGTGDHAPAIRKAGHQNRQDIMRLNRSHDPRLLSGRRVEDEGCLAARARYFDRVPAGHHLFDGVFAVLQSGGQHVIEDHPSLGQIRMDPYGLGQRLQVQIQFRRMIRSHGHALRAGFISVQRSGDLVSAGRKRQVAIGHASRFTLSLTRDANRCSRGHGHDVHRYRRIPFTFQDHGHCDRRENRDRRYCPRHPVRARARLRPQRNAHRNGRNRNGRANRGSVLRSPGNLRDRHDRRSVGRGRIILERGKGMGRKPLGGLLLLHQHDSPRLRMCCFTSPTATCTSMSSAYF